ncbi:MAG: hypothetical protein ABSB82_16895 [Terriglobia bacterium]|jgi:hypothetical protein
MRAADMRRGTVWKNRPRRVAWLARHPELWDRSRLEVLKQMQRAGLYSRTTKPLDIRLDSLVAEASGFEESRMKVLSEKTRLRLEGKRLAGD